ncbi:SSU ribosomal protein S13P [Borrelia duttonii CR2A]|uniref:Small ribosomal subunit protein uS13 n=5 Tax=Borrelia TaxID=138 RepID=RS13_BORDL|nr:MULTISPECIES: 30S ribosomal protein S13 [Borrelia]B5RM58.1 RecName: Full=Small ribosomal subunit protein uS13; AltName: Full=30S ribosomal protein S13 [Borrelia duttonii Ly]B5RPK4.1 RecName: Full=Small ribosomal subunit protein uS13; AltName: Full=30S ribosomal protein S13 [Borrelia recurrentis A1]ACH93444.1 30S ribosomal protein S13 [Borrelia duttonii Ly]ACH94738.1 30S ribosomal protein S13 [Borrelia recurrentis A1]AFI31286.1 30S ribosomal protein S13 [Borrelia crocidurae str. Achema]AHH0
MARIAGIDLPNNKQLQIALTSIYGIGRSRALEICKKTGILPEKRAKDLDNEEVNKLRKIIESDYVVEGKLRSELAMSIKRLMDIACYRGLRHRKGLPLRGQRTKTNARTRKGKRKTVANKKIAAK